MDNTVIGGTTPAVGTFTTGTFDSLSVGTLTNDELSYVHGVDNAIQDQIDSKAPINAPAFTGNATFDNEVTAVQFNSSGADGTHFINVLNQAVPSDVTRGNCYTDNTTLALTCADGATYSSYAGTVTPSTTDTFTNKTYNVSGTGNVFKQYQYLRFVRPVKKGATAVSMVAYDSGYTESGQVQFSNSETAASGNCAYYYGTVPEDIDTSADMKALFKFSISGSDTGSHSYVIAKSNTANSAYAGGSFSDNVTLSFAGDGSGSDGEVETIGWTTLTGWGSALTANNYLGISVCRDGGAAGDSSTDNSYTLSLDIKYGVTQ